MKNRKLSCEQVMALMSFYVENKLSEHLAKCVKEHLDSCPQCSESFQNFQTMLGKYFESENSQTASSVELELSPFQNKQYDEFKKYVSEYLDNELDDNQNIRIKKIAITNPLARQELESMYNFKKILHLSFDRTKNEIREDFSKGIMSLLQHDRSFIRIDSFFKLSASFVFVILAIVVCFWLVMF